MNMIPEPVTSPVRQPLSLIRLVTSYFVSPTTLAIFRGCTLIYAIVVFACNVVNYRHALLHFFTQFTCLAYLGLIVYLMVSFGLSCAYLKNPDDELRNSALGRYPSLRLAYTILYTTTQVFHAVIPIIYWTVVMRTGFEYVSAYQFWLSLSLHGGNIALTLIEMCLNKIRLSWTHVPSVLLVVISYFALVWIYFAYTGHSAYMAISGYNTWSTLFVRYILVLAIFATIYIVIYYLHKVRTNLGESLTETDQNIDVVITEVTKEDTITEPKPTLWSSSSVLSPSSKAQTFGHVLTFF